MPLYLSQASYSPEAAKALIKEGGTKRRAAVKQLIESLGGKLHAFYFSFGESDVVSIGEFPDETTAVACALAINASGTVRVRTTALITPEDVDAASKKAVSYRPPGAA
jgi:uncharacterized protein with GYD domain